VTSGYVPYIKNFRVAAIFFLIPTHVLRVALILEIYGHTERNATLASASVTANSEVCKTVMSQSITQRVAFIPKTPPDFRKSFRGTNCLVFLYSTRPKNTSPSVKHLVKQARGVDKSSLKPGMQKSQPPSRPDE
jgi:hypothetical protein